MDYNTTSTETRYTTSYDKPYTSDSNAAGGAGFWIITLALVAIVVVAMWKVFEKAKKPGWAALIPIYNNFVLLQIVGRPTWWILLYFIPFVNLIINIIVAVDLAKSFGKTTTFGVIGLFLFGFIGFPMLAFGKDTYKGPSVK